ncbi:MAG: class I SAM-dependent methyltransferase [Acidimicrobiales bacterium]
MDHLAEIERFWDDDAATYDDSPGHRPRAAAVQAAWAAALGAFLPAPPARVLDCGAGTGFLTMVAARAGHAVTAVDLSARMLERLAERARSEGFSVTTVQAAADAVPDGPFDAVMERHLVWTLPDPVAALRRWRAVAPAGRLVVFESVWGDSDPVERLRSRARDALRWARSVPPDHHGAYPAEVRAALPFGTGTPPEAVVAAVAEAGWPAPRLVRLRDVEWAERQALALPERLVGVAPRFAVVAG